MEITGNGKILFSCQSHTHTHRPSPTYMYTNHIHTQIQYTNACTHTNHPHHPAIDTPIQPHTQTLTHSLIHFLILNQHVRVSSETYISGSTSSCPSSAPAREPAPWHHQPLDRYLVHAHKKRSVAWTKCESLSQ